ncbi:hypothetical protein [Brevundimonas sp.]|uniref:hypothetical protein n=1 Tax=Brevundimonas sp. TaxID=1871086 RepID=UPI0028997944|nr:hypothetical protein [Brevundimonas sp.]
MLGSLRLSERRELADFANEHQEDFIEALRAYLLGWETSNWFEKYNVESAGKWVAMHCSDYVRGAALKLAESKCAANKDEKDQSSIPDLTYITFKNSLLENFTLFNSY